MEPYDTWSPVTGFFHLVYYFKADPCSSMLSILHSFSWLYNISFGEGNGNPLQYSCLENPMDRRDLYAAVHRVR